MRPYGNCKLDALSFCFYEKVFGEFAKFEERYGRLVPELGADVFMHGVRVGQAVRIKNALKGEICVIELLRVKPPAYDGQQQLVFSVNGQPYTATI